MKDLEIPCFIFLVTDNRSNTQFIEVIVKRPYRYLEPELLKKIPKKYYGIKVKIL